MADGRKPGQLLTPDLVGLDDALGLGHEAPPDDRTHDDDQARGDEPPDVPDVLGRSCAA